MVYLRKQQETTGKMTLTVRVAGILKRCFAVIHPCVYGMDDADTAGGTAAIETSLAKEVSLLMPKQDARAICRAFVESFPAIRKITETDVQAAYEGDPAATSPTEVVLAYPGLYAITTHRIAHELYKLHVPIIPRIMSELAHSKTGIDIHPGATIGEGFFIDHGTGVVIGETTVIGKNVKLYQGVTLGALSFPKDPATGVLMKGHKRHPNIEDNVVIYAGATILGGDTTIGHDSEIGGNVWLIESVPPCSRVYNKPPKPEVRTTRC